MGRRGRKESRAENHRRELPPDIILSQILPRLPVKSLLCFKCVSKQWYSFITTPAFVKMQLHHATTPKLVALSTAQPYKFFTMDCKRPQDGFIAGPPFSSKSTIASDSRSIQFLTSVHGLVCVGIWKHRANKACIKYSDLILWNPATNDSKTLSKPPTSLKDCYRIYASLFSLYYSSRDDDYKLVRVTHHPNVYIYSLKSDSWRKVELDFQNINLRSYYWSLENMESGISLNGTIYFYKVLTGRALLIVMFNTKTETLKVMTTHDFGYEKETVTCLNLKVERDECIHMWVNIHSFTTLLSRNELWRMDREGHWTMLVKYSLASSVLFAGLRPMHLMMNENLLMYDSYRGECVYQLDLKTNTRGLLTNTTGSVCVRHVGSEYIETMVSPNQYMN